MFNEIVTSFKFKPHKQMTQKIVQLIIAPFAGLIVAFSLFILNQYLLFKFYLPFDPEFPSFLDPFQKSVYAMLFVASMFTVILFQIFFAVRVFKKYVENKRILNLSIGQLIVITSLIFASLITLKTGETFYTTKFLILRMLAATVITIAYLTTNYFIFKHTKNGQNGGYYSNCIAT